jgi:hypothetical protein
MLLTTSNLVERTAESIDKKKRKRKGIESFFEKNIIVCKKYKYILEK